MHDGGRPPPPNPHSSRSRALVRLEVAREDPVDGPSCRDLRVVGGTAGELGEIDVGEETARCRPRRAPSLVEVAPPGRVDDRVRLSVTDGSGSLVLKATLKKAAGCVADAGAARVGRVGDRLGQQVAVAAASHRPTPAARRTVFWPGFQSLVGDLDLDLPALSVHRDGGRGAADGRVVCGVDEVGRQAWSDGVDGEEQVGRRCDVRAVGEREKGVRACRRSRSRRRSAMGSRAR